MNLEEEWQEMYEKLERKAMLSGLQEYRKFLDATAHLIEPKTKTNTCQNSNLFLANPEKEHTNTGFQS